MDWSCTVDAGVSASVPSLIQASRRSLHTTQTLPPPRRRSGTSIGKMMGHSSSSSGVIGTSRREAVERRMTVADRRNVVFTRIYADRGLAESPQCRDGYDDGASARLQPMDPHVRPLVCQMAAQAASERC